MLSEKLICNVHNLEYNFDTKIGILSIGKLDRCDMGGCISLFKSIDPDIKEIWVYRMSVPKKLYTKYISSSVKLSDDDWKCLS